MSDAERSASEAEAADALLRRLELTVRNKLDGLLQGNYLGLVPGSGTEAGESRLYFSGDDVRRMDWPVTARTGVAHVRQTIADRELETWLAVDLSASLDFGTARSDKRELVLAALTAITQLTARDGNRVGAIVSNGETTIRIPALPGRINARNLVRTIAAMPRAQEGSRGDLGSMLEQLQRPPRRRGMVVVLSDFLDAAAPTPGSTIASLPDGAQSAWARPLRALAGRHQLLAIEIVDPRELELPAAGMVTFVDTETGEQLEVQTSDAQVRRRFAEAAQQQRTQIATVLRHVGAAHLQLRTDRSWVDDIVRFVLARRHLLADTGVR
ncbi:Protein of unknown function DUF58 [Frankineae bacterium MT45]|nr:Protein of unknown function DUF58 [Frankineae bacterium MT45]